MALNTGDSSRGNLSKLAIVEAGLAIAELEGLEGVSFRKLASDLSVTPMALYRYFENKEDLLADMLDHFIHKADVLPRQIMPWDEFLVFVARRMFLALREEPGWITLFSKIQLKPGALGVMDACLGKLADAGFTRQQSVKIFFSMIHCMLGASMMHANIQAGQAMPIDPEVLDKHQHVKASAMDLLAAQQFDQIDFSMAFLIEGVRQNLSV